MSVFVGRDQTAAAPIAVYAFTACQFNNARVLCSKPHGLFSHGCSARRGICLFLLSRKPREADFGATNQTICSISNTQQDLKPLRRFGGTRCVSRREGRNETQQMTDVCLNATLRHIKQCSPPPTVHNGTGKAVIMVCGEDVAPSNLSLS